LHFLLEYDYKSKNYYVRILSRRNSTSQGVFMKEEAIEVEGTVVEPLPNAMFRGKTGE